MVRRIGVLAFLLVCVCASSSAPAASSLDESKVVPPVQPRTLASFAVRHVRSGGAASPHHEISFRLTSCGKRFVLAAIAATAPAASPMAAAFPVTR